jgi:4'-phosphopantetheinyl transferase
MRDCAALEGSCPAPAAELVWLQAPPQPALRPAEAHVLAFRLDQIPDVEHARALLSRDEKARATRFHFDLHRHRFIAGRAWLRTVLGNYLGIKPGKIVFRYTPTGKPALARTATSPSPGLCFNLAHAENLALLALTIEAEIGVDVECVRPAPDAAELVSRFFSPREAALFHELPPEQRSGAFFNLWTRKESLLKATGEGIAHSLRSVEVSFLPYEPARFLSLPTNAGSPNHWSLHELHPAPGFTAALAVASFPIHVRTFSWPAELNL